MITRERASEWLDAYGDAWEQRDPSAAAALFAEQAEYRETPFDPPMIGRAAIEEYWRDVPRSQEEIHFHHEVLAVTGSGVVALWRCSFRRIPSRAEVTLDGMFLLQFDPHGYCVDFREWWHRKETITEETKGL